jgi:hypothetical protein
LPQPGGLMPKGQNGEKRPADTIRAMIEAAQMLTAEERRSIPENAASSRWSK